VKEEDPDRYVRLSRKKVEGDLQDYLDRMKSRGLSIRHVNICHAYLATFFEQNGFRKEKELEVERYHQPARYRKRAEYIPTVQEAEEMVENAGSPKMRAAIACLYTSGLRNSTLRALLYRDVKKELEAGLEVIRLPVYHEMKRIDPDACKNDVPYYSFISKDASRILRTYVSEVRRKLGEIDDQMPLFTGERVDGEVTHMKARTLQVAVHEAARKAGIKEWKSVYPHCLRKTFQSVLRSEYSDGGRMDPKDQEFLIGHILPGSQDAYYDKTKVDPELLRLKKEDLPLGDPSS
jgi:integrase